MMISQATSVGLTLKSFEGNTSSLETHTVGIGVTGGDPDGCAVMLGANHRSYMVPGDMTMATLVGEVAVDGMVSMAVTPVVRATAGIPVVVGKIEGTVVVTIGCA